MAQITANEFKAAMGRIAAIMTENEEYLTELDRQNGDGDLGISMAAGFNEVSDMLKENTQTDLGKLFFSSAKKFNETAPSSLGTILSIGMMKAAKELKNKEEVSIQTMAQALSAGIKNIEEKAGSKQGEKTILDSLIPAVAAMETGNLDAAVQAAKQGSDSTREMIAVHGRAAYYGEKSIGILDGGSVVGYLIFKAIAN